MDAKIISLVMGALSKTPGIAEVREDERNSFIVKMEDGTEREFVMLKVGGYERQGVNSMYAHTAATYESLHKEILQRAGQAWIADRVAVAETLKEIAFDLKKRASEARAKQKVYQDD